MIEKLNLRTKQGEHDVVPDIQNKVNEVIDHLNEHEGCELSAQSKEEKRERTKAYYEKHGYPEAAGWEEEITKLLFEADLSDRESERLKNEALGIMRSAVKEAELRVVGDMAPKFADAIAKARLEGFDECVEIIANDEGFSDSGYEKMNGARRSLEGKK